MTPNNASNAYLVSKVSTATPQELTLMLYEGALKFCNQAIRAIETEKVEEAHHAIVRVQDIIFEFSSTLNMQYEVSKNLASMYEYIQRRLFEANVKKDVAILQEVQGYIRDLRDTWKDAMDVSRQTQQRVVNE